MVANASFASTRTYFVANKHQIDITGAASEDVHAGRVGKNKETISCLLQTDALSRPAKAQHHVRPVHQRQPHTVT